MGFYVNPPADGFQNIRRSSMYIDKSELIAYTNRVIGTPQGLICFSRPRRFGKSFAAKMLAAYYAAGIDADSCFYDLKIAKNHAESYRKHLNQYDVIFLDIAYFISGAENIRDTLGNMQKSVIEELCQLYPDPEKRESGSMFDIMARISAKSGRKFYVIIDEWDAFFREAQEDQKLQEDYVRFLRNMFKSNLTPQVIAGAYMTGILPIKKYGTQSALTDFTEYTMLSSYPLSEFAGFTEDEVQSLCGETGLDFAKAKKWYDGYFLDGTGHVYNPNSIMQAVTRRRFASYWTQTETYESLQVYIDMNFDGLRNMIVEMIGGKSCRIDTGSFQNDMTSIKCRDDVCTLLVHLGYLAYDPDTGTVFIPNEEIREEFIRAVRLGRRCELVKAVELSDQLLAATLRMDEETVADLIREAHLANTSPKFYNNEQALRTVVIMAYISCVDDYRRFEELAAGRGYADILFLPVTGCEKPAILVELKWDKSADAALSQIQHKGYARAAKQLGYTGDILLVGISYSTASEKHSCKIEKTSVP